MDLPYDFKDRSAIVRYTKRLLRRTLRDVLTPADIEKFVRNESNKGEMGHALERYYFRYRPNNISGPDFSEAGLELKSTPVIYDRKGDLRPKERLVLNLIDYMTEHERKWENSSFWQKNKALLLIFYLYEKDVSILDLLFKLIDVWEYPPADLKIIKEDWVKIINKIRAGKAHEISESDTFYLGACTKGTGHGGNLRQQPFSSELAPQRAYSLKSKYISTIIARWSGELINVEPILKGEFNQAVPFEELVIIRFQPYIGMSINDIHQSLALDINRTAKNYYATVTLRILGVRAKKAEEFEKADVIIRTVRLKHNNMPKEDISFPYFKYKEIVTEEWDTSTFRALLERKFFFVIYKYNAHGELVLRKVTFWNMPYRDLQKAKWVWERTVELIKAGMVDELPKKSKSPVCHVRPHGRNAHDTDVTMEGQRAVKKCFWLNAGYLKNQITKDILD